jgi:hypothetical protein
MPPPAAVLNPSPRACHRLIPDLGARRYLDLGLEACRHRPLPQTLGNCCVAVVDIDFASLRLRRHCRPRLRLPWSAPTIDLTPPPSERAAAVVLDPDLPQY